MNMSNGYIKDEMQQRKHTSVAYAAGPGDIAGTYEHWSKGQIDPNEVSETYSGQFFQQMKDLDLSALVIASNPRKALIEDGKFTIEHRPKSTSGKTGLSFHIADITYWLGVMWRIRRARCSVAIVADMGHWWLLTLLRLTGVKIVPSLHCTFWPKGYRPTNFKDRVIQTLNGWFWRNIPAATIFISPECQHQVEMLSGKNVSGALIQARPRYRSGQFSNIKPPVWSSTTFRLMFAGRIEENKGLFDLIAVMKRLTSDLHLDVYLEICGEGSALSALSNRITAAGLEERVKLHGKLSHDGMLEAYQRCNAVIVPTTASFEEGLNKVVVEGVLAGRPVIATSVCPAQAVFPYSVIEVQPGDIEQMTNAILRLASDETIYNEASRHCAAESVPFYDECQSWGFAVRRALDLALGARRNTI